MKIGIISCDGWLRTWDNYGTLFQNYALQVYLKKQGHEPFWILTDGAFSGTPFQKIKFRFGQVLNDPRSVLVYAKGCVAYLLYKRRERENIQLFNLKHPRFFDSFFEENIAHTKQKFSLDELRACPPVAGAYIVGSDQIWGGVSIKTFLGFGEPETLRVAYAVSTAWSTRTKEWFACARKMIGAFDAVSVREIDGVDICAQLGRADAVHVVDPTLLLEKDDYMRVVRAEGKDVAFPKKTVLAYFLNIKKISQIPWDALVSFAEERASDLKVVPLQGAELAIPESFVFTPSPAEWLNAYDKADCILTNSFHGTLFAIIMRKPFLIVLQSGKTSAENCRFLSILRILGLESRLFMNGGGGTNGCAYRLGKCRNKAQCLPSPFRGLPLRGVGKTENAIVFQREVLARDSVRFYFKKSSSNVMFDELLCV